MANKVHTHFLPVRRTSSPSQSFHFVSSSSFCVVCVLFAFFSLIRLVCIGANSYIWLFCVLCCWVGVACAFLISKLSETFFPSQEWIMWAIFSSRSLLCGIILLLLSPVHLRIHMPLRFTHKNNISLSFHFGFRRVCVCLWVSVRIDFSFFTWLFLISLLLPSSFRLSIAHFTIYLFAVV